MFTFGNKMVKTIGILGGMGPEATNQLSFLITSLTPASKDQDHIPVITWNNSKIPHRIDAIFKNTKSPVPEMVRMAQGLEFLGCDYLVMPCNTAHLYLKDIQPNIRIPFINFMEEVTRYIKEQFPKVRRIGLLGTNMTAKMKLYETPLLREDFVVLMPSEEKIEDVTKAIYEIKSGRKDRARILFKQAAKELIDNGAEVVISGCTEIPLVLNQENVNFPLIDPSLVVAKRVVELSLGEQANTELLSVATQEVISVQSSANFSVK
ncbi:aspartate racemase [archaeon]|nr:aspartate racemase [archaeon]|tara:strand:- start:2758 stop:3549 length:792 start_codon:yes stop_codon:yes gene_type:complete